MSTTYSEINGRKIGVPLNEVGMIIYCSLANIYEENQIVCHTLFCDRQNTEHYFKSMSVDSHPQN